jgi:hypothetical protein
VGWRKDGLSVSGVSAGGEKSESQRGGGDEVKKRPEKLKTKQDRIQGMTASVQDLPLFIYFGFLSLRCTGQTTAPTTRQRASERAHMLRRRLLARRLHTPVT